MESVRKNVSGAAARNIERWLTEPKYIEYRPALSELIDREQWSELEDAFFTELQFGTGGIRGITGLGSARVSRITIAEATQALCTYAAQIDDDASKKGIVIACDTRLTSDEFSILAAEVCAGNGFKAHLFEGYRSTPELSFAVRHLNVAAGIVISASHNFPTDNGFKAYMSDGGQLVAPHDKQVISLVRDTMEINRIDFETGLSTGSIMMIGEELDRAYVDAVLQESMSDARKLKIVYSPLHGAGQRNTLPVLREAGFTVKVVDKQMTPDGNFPTVENNKPNPEERVANDMAVSVMMDELADIAITNDPDADRIGVMVRQGEEVKYLNGNQAAALATEYVLSKLSQAGGVSKKHYVAKTIVTTDLLNAIAERYGATVYGDMLIGFKYIGELLLKKESTDEIFAIGGEESYGLLKGTYARDKDGAVGALVLAEYAAELLREGKTLYDQLLEMYVEYGVYAERLDNIICPGASGFTQMQSIMAGLRTTPPTRVGTHDISAVSDYESLMRVNSDGTKEPLACEVQGNVIVLEFGDSRRRVTIRPSGTEAKLKLYVQWFSEYDAAASKSAEQAYDDLFDMLEGLSRELEGLLLRT